MIKKYIENEIVVGQLITISKIFFGKNTCKTFDITSYGQQDNIPSELYRGSTTTKHIRVSSYAGECAKLI